MDEDIGIEVFITSSEGIGGKIKKEPEDFVVEEVSIYPPPSNGRYVIARVKARNWEANRLVEKMAYRLGISPNSIGYAGIKDKRAVTVQIMSFPASIKKVASLSLQDVEVEVLYKSSRPVYSGKLIGNRFHIVVRDVEKPENVEEVMGEIEQMGYMPNFFGVQRFGIARPITHVVGKHLIKNEIREAVMSYVANPMEGEDEENYEARKFLQETEDFEEALKIYPKKLVFERRIIEHLSTHPGEWKEALLLLPKNLIRLFVHAYQSYLFNRIVSLRVKRGIPLNEAVVGDIVIPWEKEMVIQSYEGIMVEDYNLDKINRRIRSGKCFPSAAIVGYGLMRAKGAMGEIEEEIMEAENIGEEEFIMRHFPGMEGRGMRRVIMIPLKRIIWNFDGSNLFLNFFLPRGCYATSLLREIMKPESVFSY